MEARAIHEGNRDAWNRTALGGYGSDFEQHLTVLRGGGVNLFDTELRVLGDLGGWCERAIHLQCSHGYDTLSLLNIGADEVTGVDISEEMIALAKAKSSALGARATWIRSDVLDAPHDLDGTADLVYTGKGATCWMMDLDAWARVVARLLKSGGKFFLYEGHPLDFVWEEEADRFVLRKGASYFRPQPNPERGFPFAAAGKVAAERPVSLTSRLWTIGETVTAVVNAGLRILHLEETSEPFWDQFKMIPETELHRLPHTFALLASKP